MKGYPIYIKISNYHNGRARYFHYKTWRTQYHYRDDREYTDTREQGIQTC